MSLTAFLLVTLSALLHATWNLIAKKNHITFAFYTLICTMCTLTWLHVLFWTPLPFSAMPSRFWLFMAASVVSDLMYCTGLWLTYKYMEMSTAYPVMRSLPILLTYAVTSLLGFGTPLSLLAKLGCLVVFMGCLLMPLKRFSDLKLSSYLSVSMLCVLLAAMGTTGYTVLDKEAQNVLAAALPEFSKPLRSITFYSLRSLSLTSTLWLTVLSIRPLRHDMFRLIRERNWKPCLCGICASCTYVLVLLAMNYVTNVTYVQCFRQLGLPLGLFAGILFLKESCTATKLIGVMLIVSGLAMTVL